MVRLLKKTEPIQTELLKWFKKSNLNRYKFGMNRTYGSVNRFVTNEPIRLNQN